MAVTRHAHRRRDVHAATVVIFIILTGAFVLQDAGIHPLLPQLYQLLFSRAPPAYFRLAFNAAGSFNILYSVFYVILLEPAFRTLNIKPELHRLDFNHFTTADFILPVMIYAVYAFLAASHGLPLSQSVMLGGLTVILAGFLVRVIPRWLARHLPQSPFYALEIALTGLPATILALLPVLGVVAWLPGVSVGPFF